VLAIRKGATPHRVADADGHGSPGKRRKDARRRSATSPLSGLDDLAFGGWDIFETTAAAAARTAGDRASLLDRVRPELEKIRPWPASSTSVVKRLDGPNVKKGKNKRTRGTGIADIRKFKIDHAPDRLVMVCGSTEIT
jgi:hypothetical protein